MRYREFHPKSPLNTVVECFWTLESEADDLAASPDRILPDGCVELILNFGNPFQQHIDNDARLQPRNFVVGQMTGPIVIAPTGPAQVIGIRFHPGGTTPFFSVPMHELTDQIVELGGIASRLERSLTTCGDIRSIAGKVTLLESILTDQLQRGESDLRLLQVAGTMVASGGAITVDSLAGAFGISSRQLERKFLNEVGVGPKMLSRILRFQQVFRAVESNQFSWPSIAIECGYYDQAHLIRDFRQFAQETPSTLLAESSPLTESFTRKTRMSNFSNTPQFEAVWDMPFELPTKAPLRTYGMPTPEECNVYSSWRNGDLRRGSDGRHPSLKNDWLILCRPSEPRRKCLASHSINIALLTEFRNESKS